jgi:hypothetical protein
MGSQKMQKIPLDAWRWHVAQDGVAPSSLSNHSQDRGDYTDRRKLPDRGRNGDERGSSLFRILAKKFQIT